jgi:hypothetical protein
MPILLLILIASIVLALDIKATRLLNRSSYYDANQKMLQFALIWLVPVLGAILVWSLTTDTPKRRFTTDLRDHAGYDDGWIRSDSSASDIGGGDAGGSD